MTRAGRGALVAGAVALGGAVLVAVLAAFAGRQTDRVLAAASHALGREVGAEHLGVSVWGGVAVALTGVRIADDPALETGEPLMTARRLALRLRLLPLLRRRLVVDRVVVDEPIVNLVRMPDGRLNVDSLGRRDGPAPGAPAGAGDGEQSRPAFQPALLRLRDGTVRYRDRSTDRTVELTQVALDVRQPRFGAPLPMALRARLAAGSLTLEQLRSEGTLDLAADRPSYAGMLDGGPGAVSSLPLARLRAKVQATPTVVALDDVTLELLDGSATGSIRLASEGEAAGLVMKATARGIDLARLAARPDKLHAEGTLALEGDLTGPPVASPVFRLGLTGKGRFDVAGGRIAPIPLGHTVRDLLAPLLGGGTAARLRERYPDIFGGDELRFTRLAGSVSVAGTRIRSDDLVLTGPSYEAHGAGSLGLDGRLDATLALTASAPLTDDLLGRSQARTLLADTSGRLVVPLRLEGELHSLQVSPDPRFTALVARALLGDSGTGDAAAGLLERLLNSKHRRKH